LVFTEKNLKFKFLSKISLFGTYIGTYLNIDFMSKYADYFKDLHGKHTVALEFLADAGVITPKNVTKALEMGKESLGVKSNPNFLRLRESFSRYPNVLRGLTGIS
jgi:hypothetical protein